MTAVSTVKLFPTITSAVVTGRCLRVQRNARGLHPLGEDIEEGIGGGIPGQEVAEVRHDVPDSPTKPKKGVVRDRPMPEPQFAHLGTGIPGLWVPCEPGRRGLRHRIPA